MRICYHVINIKMIHLILVRLQTTSGYVSHCSIKGGRGAQLPLVEQKKRGGRKKKKRDGAISSVWRGASNRMIWLFCTGKHMQIAPPSNVVNFRVSWLRGGTRQRYPPTWRDVAEKSALTRIAWRAFLAIFPFDGGKKKSLPRLTLDGNLTKGREIKHEADPVVHSAIQAFVFLAAWTAICQPFTCRGAMIFARLTEHPAKQYFTC